MIEYSLSRQSHGSSSQTVEHALEYWDKGGIVTLCWHWNAPEKYLTDVWYKGFYKEYTNIDLKAIMDGRDTEGYTLLLNDIEVIAKQLKQLCDAGVPILWRPLHEASGGWFWWGSAGPEAYKELYCLLYDEMTNHYQLGNLIWVWNGQDKDWYPGDEYVDIIGEDIYPGEHVYTPQSARFMQATKYTKVRKMIVLSENGCLFDPDLALRDSAMWGYFCTWGGEFVAMSQAFNDISERYTELNMVQKVYAHEIVVTRNELPDLKNYPLRVK
jgi:mannan endo-1,4-beta-mannosidase